MTPEYIVPIVILFLLGVGFLQAAVEVSNEDPCLYKERQENARRSRPPFRKKKLMDLNKIMRNNHLDGDWVVKETRKNRNGEEYWIVENKKDNTSFYLLNSGDGSMDDEDVFVETIPFGDILFSVIEFDADYGGDGKMWGVSYNPLSHWKADRSLWDQHMGYVIEFLFDVPEWAVEDELMENAFCISTEHTREEIIDTLTKAGLVHSPELEKFLGGK